MLWLLTVRTGLLSFTSVTVTVERNGQPEVLVLDTSELGNASDQDDE